MFEMSMNLNKVVRSLLLLVSLSAIGLITTYFLYPQVILELYGKEMPEKWASNFGGMSFSQIYQRLGPPQEDASAKDYQQWVESHWWGIKLLKVISVDCCQSASKPSIVMYLVYVNGWYDPVYRKTLSKTVEK